MIQEHKKATNTHKKHIGDKASIQVCHPYNDCINFLLSPPKGMIINAPVKIPVQVSILQRSVLLYVHDAEHILFVSTT